MVQLPSEGRRTVQIVFNILPIGNLGIPQLGTRPVQLRLDMLSQKFDHGRTSYPAARGVTTKRNVAEAGFLFYDNTLTGG